MMSKNLFFKLMKEDFKRRLWAVALIGLACFFLYPVVAAFMAGNIPYASSYERGLAIYTRDMVNLLSFHNGGAVFGMVVSALICGLSSFSYLNSKSKVDFYHGIPVRREKLYAANYLNGILILAVPYGISVVLAVIVGVSNGISNHVLTPVALSAYGLNLVYYILMYSTVVLAAMLTGNTVVGFLGSVVFAVVVPLAVSVINGYYFIFFKTHTDYVENLFYKWGVRISPLMEYIVQVRQYGQENSVLPAAMAALAISVLLALLGCFLYRKRPSEAAGKAMAFAVSRPINRIVLTLISAMGLGAFFWSMRSSTGWAVFGVICGAVICHCVVEIIYNFDFKKLFSHKLQLIGCILVSLAVLLVFRYDLLGYDTYLPKAEQVRSAAIDVRILDRWVTYGGLRRDGNGGYYWDGEDSSQHVCQSMEYGDVENLLEIAREGIRQLDRMEDEQYAYREGIAVDDGLAMESEEESRPETWTDVVIRYTLQNGRRVYRRYGVCLEDIQTQIDQLKADEGFQKGTYPVMNRQQGQVAAIRYREGEEEFVLDELSMEKKDALLAAYQKEFGAMTIERMYEEAPVGLIRFTSSSEELAMKWAKEQERLENSEMVDTYIYDSRYSYGGYRNYGNLATRDYYPVYPSFRETLALLEKEEISPGKYFKEQDMQRITIHKYGDGTNDTYQYLLITDPEEISMLMEVLQDYDLTYYNPIFQQEGNIGVELSLTRDGESYIDSACFPKGQVPQWVWNRFKEQQ